MDNDIGDINAKILLNQVHQIFSFLLREICENGNCTIIQYNEGDIVQGDTLNRLGMDSYEIRINNKLIFFHSRIKKYGMVELEMVRFFEMIDTYPQILPLDEHELEVIQYFLKIERQLLGTDNKNQ